jgi:hypothetical protein
VPSKGIGEIKATFFPRGYKGKVKKSIYVQSNDPKNPTVKLSIIGNVSPPSQWIEKQTTPTF